jgi:uracil-DNA glycosylase
MMRPSEHIQCVDFPCEDTNRARYTVPGVDLDPSKVRILMVAEAPPPDEANGFYAPGEPFYLQTTLQAFEQAGVKATSMQELLDRGVYITTAIKCGKTGYGVATQTVKNCSPLLEQEVALFPNVRAIMLMGDVAIKAMVDIAKRQTGRRTIPSGATYKVRKGEYAYGSVRLFPTYLMTGKSFLIEKSKQAMIADDIRAAMALLD